MQDIPSNLEFTYAPEFKKHITALCDNSGSIALDLQHVERASLACIQIILAAKKAADKDNKTMLIQPSESLMSIIKDMGLETEFKLERT